MLPRKLEKALNDQMAFESYSAYIYLSMSAWLEGQDLPGFANWMRVQTLEEMVHAAKFYSFIVDREGTVSLAAIEKPPASWKSPLAVFEHAHSHEQEVTRRIHALVDLARAERDHATESFLQWFVTEQVEEEKNTKSVAQQIRMAGNAGQGLFLVNRELPARVFAPPAGCSFTTGAGPGAP